MNDPLRLPNIKRIGRGSFRGYPPLHRRPPIFSSGGIFLYLVLNFRGEQKEQTMLDLVFRSMSIMFFITDSFFHRLSKTFKMLSSTSINRTACARRSLYSTPCASATLMQMKGFTAFIYLQVSILTFFRDDICVHKSIYML